MCTCALGEGGDLAIVVVTLMAGVGGSALGFNPNFSGIFQGAEPYLPNWFITLDISCQVQPKNEI